jgi:F0F1-type ATP synthase delta subunit
MRVVIVQRLQNLISFHPSIDHKQKSEFFDAVFEAQLQVITRTLQLRQPNIDLDPLLSLALQWIEHGIKHELYDNNLR